MNRNASHRFETLENLMCPYSSIALIAVAHRICSPSLTKRLRQIQAENKLTGCSAFLGRKNRFRRIAAICKTSVIM